jgi:hypothetical protein
VDDEEAPFAVRIRAVEDGQVATSARRRSGRRDPCGVVEREIRIDRVEGSAGIGHDDRVLASGRDEEHVDAIRPPVRQVPEGDVDVSDRARAARDLAPRRVRVRGASSANDDESAAWGPGPRSLRRGAESSDDHRHERCERHEMSPHDRPPRFRVERILEGAPARSKGLAPADHERDAKAARAAGAGLRALADDPADHP